MPFIGVFTSTEHLQEDSLGKKASYGCIRMRSSDVIEVFNWITVGTGVAIVDKPLGRAVKELGR